MKKGIFLVNFDIFLEKLCNNNIQAININNSTALYCRADEHHKRWNQFMKAPLYFKHGSIHEISGLKKFVLVAQHILKNQYMGKLTF